MNTFIRSALAIFVIVLCGCHSDQQESLHENEHFVPAHWPRDLSDAAVKIDERLAALQNDAPEPAAAKDKQAVFKELVDIVGWVPEVAADSFIVESQWLPVYESSTKLSEALQRSSPKLDPETIAQLQSLKEALNKTAEIEAKNRPDRKEAAAAAEIVQPSAETPPPSVESPQPSAEDPQPSVESPETKPGES